MKTLIKGLCVVALFFYLIPAVRAQAPSNQLEDYSSGQLTIKNNAITRSISDPVAFQSTAKVNPPRPTQQNGRNNLSEANGDIQIRMRDKVIAKWSENEWPAMHYILDHESGSDPYAKNPVSSACGIPQATPCSKMLAVIGSLDNVEGQLDWMLNYVAQRYKTPTGAMNFHLTHNYY